MDDLITFRKAAPSPRRDKSCCVEMQPVRRESLWLRGRISWWSGWGRLLAGLWGGFAATACSPQIVVDHPPKLNSVQESASVRVAALSVARWEDYVDSLQAQYALTPDGALALAIPQTSISHSSIANAVGLGLQIGLPQSTRTQAKSLSTSQGNTTASTTATTGTSTTNTSKGATNNANSTGTRGPGAAAASALPAQTAPSVHGIAGPSGTVQTDALTTYTVATAIYQEVQLSMAATDGVLRQKRISVEGSIAICTTANSPSAPTTDGAPSGKSPRSPSRRQASCPWMSRCKPPLTLIATGTDAPKLRAASTSILGEAYVGTVQHYSSCFERRVFNLG
jgi:hypothetical protein